MGHSVINLLHCKGPHSVDRPTGQRAHPGESLNAVVYAVPCYLLSQLQGCYLEAAVCARAQISYPPSSRKSGCEHSSAWLYRYNLLQISKIIQPGFESYLRRDSSPRLPVRSARTHGEGVSVVGGYQWMMVGHQLVDGFPFPVSGALPPVREFTGSR